MTRGRKQNPVAEALPDTLDRKSLAEANTASQLVSAASFEIVQSAELHKLVGRIETAHFLETVSAKLLAETYVKARALLGELGQVTVRGKDGSPETVSDMDTFCQLAMPVSARRCQQIVASIETLGSDLFEQAERIGFRARDYQALKALPSDDQAAVKKALDGGSREEVLDLLTELAARNEALRKREAEAQKSLKAKQKVLTTRDEKILELEERLAARYEPGELEGHQLTLLQEGGTAAEAAIRQLMVGAAEVLLAPANEATATAARQAVEYVAQLLASLINEAGVAVDFTEAVSPHWLQATAGGKTKKR